MTATTKAWPFGTDAVENDPLTKLRIPVVTSFNPGWHYVAAYLGTNADIGSDWEPSWPFASTERPTDTEAQMLVSYLQEHRNYWFNDTGYALQMDRRPLDIDGGWNTTVFIKYAPDDWGYRRCSWNRGPTFVPQPPTFTDRTLGPLSLEQVMDRVHTLGADEPSKRWLGWKTDHPDVFGGAS